MHDEYDQTPDDDNTRSDSRSYARNTDSRAPQRTESTEYKPPVEIPLSALSAEALDGVIESFVLREGTDYGAVEVSLEAKLGHVHSQLQKGEVKIVFDPMTESVTLMTKNQWLRSQSPE